MCIGIIVSADDLGISETVNDAIFRGMERGVITSASILPNGPAVESAAERTRRFPECSFGAHLNITQFKPMSAKTPSLLPGLIDNNNQFFPKAIWRIGIGLPELKAIYQEWCAQIEHLTLLGVRLSHLDTHQHVHTIPRMLPVLTALRHRYRINKIRISRNIYGAGDKPACTQLLAKKWLYNRALRVAGFRTTESFTDLQTFLNLCSVRPPRTSTIELSTHPGAEHSRHESHLLEDDLLHKLSYDIKLVSYNNL